MNQKKILLANDPELLQILKDSFFNRMGFRLLVAKSGQQAFEIIEEEDPVLAILDLAMPDLAGDECCRKVKNDPFLRSTPIILLAHAGREKELARCRKAACDDIVLKPVKEEHLLVIACNLLNIIDRAPERVPAQVPAKVGLPAKKLHSGNTLNLNSGGAFIKTSKLQPIDTLLALEVSIPELPEPVRCQGRVAWVNHPEWLKNPKLPVGMGVQFLGLDKQGVEAICSYLDLLATQALPQVKKQKG